MQLHLIVAWEMLRQDMQKIGWLPPRNLGLGFSNISLPLIVIHYIPWWYADSLVNPLEDWNMLKRIMKIGGKILATSFHQETTIWKLLKTKIFRRKSSVKVRFCFLAFPLEMSWKIFMIWYFRHSKNFDEAQGSSTVCCSASYSEIWNHLSSWYPSHCSSENQRYSRECLRTKICSTSSYKKHMASKSQSGSRWRGSM